MLHAAASDFKGGATTFFDSYDKLALRAVSIKRDAYRRLKSHLVVHTVAPLAGGIECANASLNKFHTSEDQ